MKIDIEIPEFNKEKGFEYKWENNFDIGVKAENGVVIITANKEGLTSLANHLLNLAQEKVPSGYHLHLDEYNSLDDGSLELIVQKK